MKKSKYRHAFFRNVKVNRVIRYLTFSDLLYFSGWGLINPILAIFFTNNIVGGDVRLAGSAIGVYFFVKSIVQIPVARYIDLEKGENDDFWVMVLGSSIISLVPFLYILISEPWQVYGVQILQGLGAALAFPPWPAIFTRHIDKHEEGIEWSLYYSATDIGTAITGFIGGYIASIFGYPALMMTVGCLNTLSTLMLFKIKKDLRKTT